MKLEELVPDIKLCELIPQGEFEDTELLWCAIDIDHKFFVFRHSEFYKKYKDVMLFVKAPTLEEIMAKFPHCACVIGYLGWSAASYYIGNNLPKFASNGVTAALKLWLKLKGIDYGK